MLVDKSYTLADLEVFNLLKHPVWILRVGDGEAKDPEIEVVWSNEANTALYGTMSLEAFLDRKTASFMSESTRHRVYEGWLLARKGAVLNEQATVYPNDVPTVLNITCSGIRLTFSDNKDNESTVALLMEAKVADSEYQESAVRQLEMLRHLPVPACQFDAATGKHVYQNPEAVRVYGAGEKKLWEHFGDAKLGQDTYAKALKDENLDVDVHVQAELVTATEGHRWFSVVIRRTRDPAKKSTDSSVLLMTARDITEILEIRREKAMLHLKAEFLAVLAHDIRTPLHQIVGCMDLLETTGNQQLTREQKEHIRIAQFSATSLVNITTDLLDYSKLESGKLELSYQFFDLDTLLQGCTSAMRQDSDEKGLDLTLTARNNVDVSKLYGDPYRLRRVLLNLLDNAIRYTSHGSVALTAVCSSATPRTTDEDSTMGSTSQGKCRATVRIRFEVVDTGIGLSMADQAAIFDKYTSAGGKGNNNYEGTGLGLPISRALVEAMGGVIGLRSAPGEGATFHFEIPFGIEGMLLEKSNSSNKNLQKEADKSISLDKGEALQILVAEDNKINQKVVRSMLQRIGHVVTIAENGQLAVDTIKTKRRFDLVLMDRMMPQMDGIEATLAIRAMGISKSELPIVGLTASYQKSELDFYLKNGMNDCLGKPVRLASLKRTISDVMHGDRG